MHELEFETIRTQEIHRVVAADPECKLSRPIEDGTAEIHHQLRQLIDARVSVGVEGDMMQARL